MIACPSCGKENEDYYRFCLGCGTKIENSQSPKPIPLVEESPPKVESHTFEERPQERPPSVIIEDQIIENGPPEPETAPAPPVEDAYADDFGAQSIVEHYTEVEEAKPGLIMRDEEIISLQEAPKPASLEPESFAPVEIAKPITPEPVLPIESPTTEPTQKAALSTDEQTCPNCRKEIPEGFLFCGSCGTRLPEPKSAHTMYMHSAFKPDTQERICAKLVLIRPDGGEGDYFPIRNGSNTMGRSRELALFSQDNLLSPTHATFTYKDNALFVIDEGSLNGVYLKLNNERQLLSGDYFRVGQQILCYEDRANFEIIIETLKSDDDSFVMGSPDQGYWGRLVQVIAPNINGNFHLLSGNEVTLGRERSTITFPNDGFISANHASIIHRENGTFLRDLGSTNGTYLRLPAETQLIQGDLLLLGQQLFIVEILG